jgi:ABC-type Fe3+-siderophore transport system permease subunit
VQPHAKSAALFELRKAAHALGTSIVTGLAALILATSITHLLCWRAHIRWRPTFGYTFVWRLNFLSRVPAASRNEFLNAAASRCQLPEARQMLAMLATWFEQSKPWDPVEFVREARVALFSSSGKIQDEKFDRSLNEMAHAFLCPPSTALRSAALDDFESATQLREADVVHYLFVTTAFFYNHGSRMPQLAQLRSFREPRTALIDVANRFYFRWWNPIVFWAWSVIGLLVLLMALFMNIKSKLQAGPAILYAATLSSFGAIMVVLNCFFAEIQPRFALPMIEFLLLSMMILLGLIFREWHQRFEKF